MFLRKMSALLLGILLLNYMNGYVGGLTLEGPPLLLGILGWHPWAVLRVTGFLCCAVILLQYRQRKGDDRRAWEVARAETDPSDGSVSRRLGPASTSPTRALFTRWPWRGFGVVMLLLAADVVLKWQAAAGWRELIRSHMMG